MVSSSEIRVRSAGGRANGTIRSVAKVVDILEVLSRESHGLALGELAKRLDLNASTAHHLLATLKVRGMVAQDERTKTYRIGYRLVSLVSRFLSGTDLYPAAIGPVEELRDLSGETSYFSAFQGGEVAVIIALTGARPVQARRFHRPGQSNLHSTATGKVLLAYLPPEDAEAALAASELAQFTLNTITDRQQLARGAGADTRSRLRDRPRRRLCGRRMRRRTGLRRRRGVRGSRQRFLPCGLSGADRRAHSARYQFGGKDLRQPRGCSGSRGSLIRGRCGRQLEFGSSRFQQLADKGVRHEVQEEARQVPGGWREAFPP